MDGFGEVGVAVGIEIEIASGGGVIGSTAIGASFFSDFFVEETVVEEFGGEKKVRRVEVCASGGGGEGYGGADEAGL